MAHSELQVDLTKLHKEADAVNVALVEAVTKLEKL